jgi:uncharacterized membrane protein YhhN|uniref:lysoplasmalogenase n=1 Tax=Gelidibacter sp. TaxID=2018083 RepID=UPI00404B57A0
MLTPTEKTFSILFFIIVTLELICGSDESLTMYHYITKPSILISLILFFWTQSTSINKSIRVLTLSALIFSLLGDVLLMFVDQSPNYFMMGLIAFLIAHIFYIMVFLKHRDKNKQPLWFGLLLLIYGIGMFYGLKDGLGEMLIPVLIYMLVILTMAISAFWRNKTVGKLSYVLVFFGALFFMMSDSLLAINKFHTALPLSNVSIMLTYALAQFLIVFGILKAR